jgi:hypothetical protein
MIQAITATYVQDDDDWAITVSGADKELSARAPGIIAARDRVDQLVEQLVGDDEDTNGKSPTVVHLLDGSALAFTTAYMTARLTRSREPEQSVSGDLGADEAATDSTGETQVDTSESDEPANVAAEQPDTPAQQAPARRPLPRKELSKSPLAVSPQASPAGRQEPARRDGLQAALGAASKAG